MEAFGVEVLVSPGLTLGTVAFALLGVAMGTATGLTPGIHVNNAALLLASLAPLLPGPPQFVGVALLSAGVVHSFLDVVPALTLGVPDPAMAATALPGHRLVIEGRGREALRLSALGSGLATLLAVPLAIPLTAIMTTGYPTVRAHMPAVLVGVVAFLVATEPTMRSRAGGVVALGASGGLGLLTLDVGMAGLFEVGGVLTPLFAGLFGAPVLLDAMGGAGVPGQADARVTTSRGGVAVTALAGAVAGAIVGYLPGVSSAIAAVLALAVVPGRTGARGFVIATSGVNTSNTIFALFALSALGTPRTGVMVALEESGAPLNLPLLLAGAALASICGFLLVLLVGDCYLRYVGQVEYTRLSVGVLALLAIASFVFAGPLGVGVFVVSAVVGMIPPRFGARRVHLMGVLIVPLVVGS
jgi:putative membrane protein